MSVPTPPIIPTPPGFSSSWFGFEPCCGGNTIYFSHDGTTSAPTEGISIYTGSTAIGYDPIFGTYVPLVSNQCYRIFRGTATNPSSPINSSNYANLNAVPSFTPSNYAWDSTTNYETPCGGESPGFCPECIPQCYSLWPCDETLVPITTDTDLSPYVNGFALIQADADFGFACYYVTYASSCENAVTVVVDGDADCECTCHCYEIIGSAKLKYVDCDGNPVSTLVNGYWKGCSLIYPILNPAPGPNLIVNKSGECVDGLCPSTCYMLVDCEGIQDKIYSTAQSLSPFATLGQVVQIQGYDNCWEVQDIVSCDCAIDVVVLQAYDSCEECNPNPNYKLTSCDDPGTIVYTSTDLSEFVGQVIKRTPDCPGCWTVEEVNGPIPSDTSVIVQASYIDCEDCKVIRYKLADCTGVQESIVTTTDLSNYIDSVITLEWCPNTCWYVSTTDGIASGILGNILNEYADCPECFDSFPCVCIRIKNHDTVAHDYKFLDCNNDVDGITLSSGERSDRMCMKVLFTSYPTDYVETFGDCTNGECPPQIYPKRTVRPGYSTPICSTEKYEKITCNAAEALYKQVLTLRYGITNCCPEEDDKWLLKKQIIDLQALMDPDYTCTVNTCGCPPASCGCGTNSCNSH